MPIELDSKAFKVLSSDARVALLKKLAEKPRSLTALASEIGQSVQSTDEHLRKLEQAGFVNKTRHAKWAYFEATEAGRQVVQPKSPAVHLLLGVSFLMLLASATTLFFPQSTGSQLSQSLLQQADPTLPNTIPAVPGANTGALDESAQSLAVSKSLPQSDTAQKAASSEGVSETIKAQNAPVANIAENAPSSDRNDSSPTFPPEKTGNPRGTVDSETENIIGKEVTAQPFQPAAITYALGITGLFALVAAMALWVKNRG